MSDIYVGVYIIAHPRQYERGEEDGVVCPQQHIQERGKFCKECGQETIPHILLETDYYDFDDLVERDVGAKVSEEERKLLSKELFAINTDSNGPNILGVNRRIKLLDDADIYYGYSLRKKVRRPNPRDMDVIVNDAGQWLDDQGLTDLLKIIYKKIEVEYGIVDAY